MARVTLLSLSTEDRTVNTIAESLQARARVIAHRAQCADTTTKLSDIALAARMFARAAQLSGDRDAWARHMATAARVAFVLEKREEMH